MTRVEATADVATDARLGEGSVVWHLAQIREGAILGTNCIIGRGAYVGPAFGWATTARCRITRSSTNRQ